MIPETTKSLIFKIRPARWVGCKLLGRFWPGAYLSALGGLRMVDRPVPTLPDEDWILCRTLLGGICGTDLNMVYLRQHPASQLQNFLSWPIGLGHENVATIVRTGSSIDDLQPGQRVLVDPPLACAARKIDPPCPACRQGKPATCRNFDRGAIPPALGVGYNNFTGGSWSPYFVAHRSQVHTLPDEIPDEQAILIDPVACSLHAVAQDRPGPDEKILVFGCGIIGLGVILALRALNVSADITTTVRYPYQADLAKICGADRVVYWTRSNRPEAMDQLADITAARPLVGRFNLRFLQGGFDRLYDCTGKIDGVTEGSRLVRTGGTIVAAGTPQLGLIDLTNLWFRELKIMGVTGRAVESVDDQTEPLHSYRQVISLVQSKQMDLSPLPVALYRQNDYRKALSALTTRGKTGILKAAFDFR